MVRLVAQNAVTVQDVQQVVRKNGFTPKEAQVILSGELARSGGELMLMAGRKARYSLAESANAPDKWRELQQLASGQTIRLAGQVPSESEKGVRIEVLDFSEIAKEKSP